MDGREQAADRDGPEHAMAAGLTERRALHCRGVALAMRAAAPLVGLDPGEAALCGWVHDIGWMDGDNRSHARIGGLLLRGQGCRFWREVALHGSVGGLVSPLGVLLNVADMSVDSGGALVGFGGRLDDVVRRYGAGSVQAAECSALMDALEGTAEWRAFMRANHVPQGR